jgi:hypothetical protein
MVRVADDGAVYSGNLSTSVNSTPFTIYRWTNYSIAPTVAFSGNSAAGLSLPGLRMGDTLAIRGSGTGTEILAPLNNGVIPSTNVVLFSTTDGINFTNTVVGISGLPALASGGGPSFGVSFYTNNTFLFKPSGSYIYVVQFPANFATSAGTLVAGAVISTNALGGGTVAVDCNVTAGLTAALGTIPDAAPTTTPVSLYAAPPAAGFATLLAATNTPHLNANGNYVGTVALGGVGKTNFIYSVDCNNGVYAWKIVTGSGNETGVATPGPLQAALSTNFQASVLDLYGVDPLACPQVAMSQAFFGGELIFSDSPESPTNTGMLYLDTNVAATARSVPNRVFLYHVNGNPGGQMKFSVLLKNDGASTGTLTVLRSGYAGPGNNYALVGETAFYNWLTNLSSTTVTVAAGQTVRLDTNFDTLNVRQNALVNGIWDYAFSQPHTLMICALNPPDDPVSVGPTLGVLARDGHERGTFAACNKTYDTTAGVVIDTAAGIQQFPIAGNSDAYVTGYDNSVFPPTAETNSGNYGLLYDLQLNTSASDGRALGILLTPRSGTWGGAVNANPGLMPGGSFVIPSGGVTISSTTNAAVAGEYFPNQGQTVTLQFMPTGASSFPVRLMTVPFASPAPDLAAISNYTVNVGQTISFAASAAGTNGNHSLGFTLPLAPVGASMGASNGIFDWRATVASAGTTQNVQVSVSAGGSPSLCDTQSFEIVVNPLEPVALNALALNDTSFQLQVSGTAGPNYILQASTNLGNPGGWMNLLTNTPTVLPFILTDSNATNFSSRFYRITLGP